MKILIVVDMQKDFISGPLGTAEARAIVPYVAEKAKNTPRENLFVTLDTHQPNYMETNEGRHLPVPHCIEGTEGHALDNAIAAAVDGIPASRIIRKPTFGAVALVAVEAFDQRIVEHGHVTGSHPHGRRKNNGRVNAHHVATGDDHGTPPFALDIVFQRNAERTVIPRGTGSTIDFTGGKNKATTLGEGYDFIEFGYSHNAPSGLNGLGSLQAQSLPLRGDRTPPALLFRGVLVFNRVVVEQ